MTVGVRPMAVAGMFYPADHQRLASAVSAMMVDAGQAVNAGRTVKAVIVPHAGYRYSGAVAATAYAALAADRELIRRVVIAGPAHFVFVDGVAIPSADALATPLGPVAVDGEARDAALAIERVVVDDGAHADEHSIEVQLPFIREVLGDIPVVPLLVGRDGGGVLAAVLDAIWDADETRFVISSDLSHYLDDVTARALDRDTATAICRLEPPSPERACGAAPIAGLLTVARRHGLDAELVDLRTSADTAGDPGRVVGYGAFTFRAPS